MLVFLATACGARLSTAQLTALNASSTNGGTASATNGSDTSGTTGAGANGTVGSTALAGTQSTSGTGTNTSTTIKTATGTPTTQPSANGTTGAISAIPGLAVASSVCSGPASGPGISSSVVNVGTVTTETGPVPGLFQGAIYGMDAFTAYMNSVGGICGRKLVDQVADDDLDASQNETATQSLVGSVFSFVGSLSGVDQGGAPVLASSGVPDVGEALSTQRFDLASNFSPEPTPLGLNLAPYIYLKQKYPDAATHMAVLSVNQATDLAETQGQVAALESIGYKFVYTDENIPLTETNFSSDAQAMKAAGALGLIFVAIPSYYSEIATADQAAGLTLQIPAYASNAYDPAFIPQAGSAANGAIISSPLAMYQGEDASTVPVIALLDKWYAAVSGGQLPNAYGAWAWMSGMLFIEGLNEGGGLTRANLLTGLKKVTSFDAGGMESTANPVAKTPPYCYLSIDVVNEKFVRDPSDPATGMNCTGAPDFYIYSGSTSS